MAYQALAMAIALASSPVWRQVHRHMRKSIRLHQERGERPYLAIAYYHYAELLQKMGEPNQARDYLGQACTLFSDMGMAWWLEQAHKLNATLPVSFHKSASI